MIAYTLCFVFSTDGYCLMLKRKRPPHQGRWNAPGGKLNDGEDPLNGCQRELQEETGLTATVTAAGTLDCVDSLQPGVVYRLYLFTACHQRLEVPEANEGVFQWLPLSRVMTGQDMVHNIPLFLPALLTGHNIHGRFEYSGQFLVSYQINLAENGKGLPI